MGTVSALRPSRVTAALAAVAAAVTLALPATPARADEPPRLGVTLTGLALTKDDPSGTLTLSGTVKNVGATPARGVRVAIWRSTVLLRSEDALDAAITADDSPQGQALTDTPERVTSPNPELPPGASMPFTVKATLTDLELTRSNATYWVGVNALATPQTGVTEVEAGRARSLVTLPDAGQKATVASVIELSSRPRQIKPNLFVDDSLPAELAGRLAPLAEAAASPGVTWVIDPSLLAEVTDMADGYRVITANGTQAGTGQQAAQDFLDRLATLPRTDAWNTLYGNPDLRGVLAAGLADLPERAASATSKSGVNSRLLVVQDHLDQRTLDTLADQRWTYLTTTPQQAPATAVGDARIIAATSPDASAAGPALAGQPVNAAAILAARARTEGVQVRLIRTTDQLTTDRRATPAWVDRVPLSALLAEKAAENRPQFASDDAPRTPVGDAGRLARSIGTGTAVYGAAAPTSGVAGISDGLYARTASQAWLADPKSQRTWLDAVDSRVGSKALDTGVAIDALPHFTMSSDESLFPVTVTNRLEDPIEARVVANTDNPSRIRFDASDPISLRPGASQTVNLHAVAGGNGVVGARVHVETADGRRLTADVPILVETTNLGLIGWIIVGVSGTVLVVTTALRIRQVRAKNKESRA